MESLGFVADGIRTIRDPSILFASEMDLFKPNTYESSSDLKVRKYSLMPKSRATLPCVRRNWDPLPAT